MQHTLNIRTLLTQGVRLLKDATPTSQLDAELLLAHLLEITRTQLYTGNDVGIEESVCNQFLQLIERRVCGEPIAYLLGHREFWSLKLIVTPATLVPRPETELLVELTLSKFERSQTISIADLGTGTGAVALALAHERPHWLVVATDFFPETLNVAYQNAMQLNIHNVVFRQGDWCYALKNNEKFHAIVSNPPYIAASDMHLQQGGLPFEPQQALVSGEDGLHDLHIIITQASKHLLPGGWLLVEHGFEQAEAVSQIFLMCGYQNVTTHNDLAGCARVTAGQFCN